MHEKPSLTISRIKLSLCSVVVRCFFSISLVVSLTDLAFTWGKRKYEENFCCSQYVRNALIR